MGAFLYSGLRSHFNRLLPLQHNASKFLWEREHGGLCQKSGQDIQVVQVTSTHIRLARIQSYGSMNTKSNLVFQCNQREHELGLINTYHCHCKGPYFQFPNIRFILSPLNSTCSHFPQGGNPEIYSTLKPAQSPGFLGDLSIYIWM